MKQTIKNLKTRSGVMTDSLFSTELYDNLHSKYMVSEELIVMPKGARNGYVTLDDGVDYRDDNLIMASFVSSDNKTINELSEKYYNWEHDKFIEYTYDFMYRNTYKKEFNNQSDKIIKKRLKFFGTTLYSLMEPNLDDPTAFDSDGECTSFTVSGYMLAFYERVYNTKIINSDWGVAFGE